MLNWHSRPQWPGFFFAVVSIFSVWAQPPLHRSEPNTSTAASSVATFNEVMYHPAGDDAGMEWVEVHNQMSLNLDISGWRITGGIEFQFPTNTVFPAGGYIVIAADPERLRTATSVTNIFGPFSPRLSNSGETLRLRNQSGRLLDEMTYSDEDPWPVGADGSGASLSKRRPFDASSPAANWRVSAQRGGTPGRANFVSTEELAPAVIPLINAGSPSRWTVPPAGALDASWTSVNFDDAQWKVGKSSLGYDTSTPPPAAVTNAAFGKTVINGSGAYPNNPFDSPDGTRSFVAGNVTDGSVSDVFGVNYWLGRQGMLNEWFTLDLGDVFPIEKIVLRNTHNAHHNDRGTTRFEVWAAHAVDGANELLNGMRILTGTLTDVSGRDPIPADVFTSANGLSRVNARYLKFVALTANNPGDNVGLNEMEVYASAPLTADRAYSFDGNFTDVSGTARNAENLGATFSTNVPAPLGSGRSLSFDGVANRVRIIDLLNPAAYTISLWVNASTVRSSSLILRTDSTGPRSSWSHQIRIGGSGRFEHYLFDGTGRAVIATNLVQPGVWYHLAISAASNGEMRIYVNGRRASAPRAIGNIWTGGNQWLLGSDAGNAPDHFHGMIDDLAVWHSVLTDETISALANGASPTRTGGLHRFIESNVQEQLYTKSSSLLVRLPFANFSRAPFDALTLRTRYADGFVAYLNGFEVARRNAPAVLSGSSAALVNRSNEDAAGVEEIELTAHTDKILAGQNVLAVHALNSQPGGTAFLFSAELLARPQQVQAITNLAFSEAGEIAGGGFFLEIQNTGSNELNLDGCAIVSSTGASVEFATNRIPFGGFLLLGQSDLGFAVKDGDRLFLLGRSGELIDALELHNRARARMKAAPEEEWFFPSRATPGTANEFAFGSGIVINEIMYHHPPIYRTTNRPYSENAEQWIELHNISAETIDLAGWRLAGEIDFAFTAGTTVPPGGYLVVSSDVAALRTKYPGIAVIGNFERRLSHHSAEIILTDPAGNPANRLRYHNSHPWPAYANGGGSTLELRDPRNDNSVPESWGDSIESAKSEWRRYSYRAKAIRPLYSPAIYQFHEFRMGLLDEGEALVDNITVTEFPTNAPARQLLQNTNFASTASWRLLGNHSHSAVVAEGTDADRVLHLIATGSTSYLDNRLETTLKSGGALVPVVTGREYEIAFDAKWIAGSPQFRTELYYNKVAATTILEMPGMIGTPGRRNSIYTSNAGPSYRGLSHWPVVPLPTENIQVRIEANDPDGLAAIRLFYKVNAAAWRNIHMTSVEGGVYDGTIPPQSNGAVIQFYVEGTDSLGAVSTYPARGANSRALIKVDAPKLVSGKQTFRTIMTGPDSALLHSAINMMSDDLLGCTVVHNESEVFYDAKIRLHGSMWSRYRPHDTGLTIKFPADHRFRGSRESVIVRRRGLVENFVKHILNSAGGLPGNYDDVVHLVSHRSDNIGTARLNMANYDDTYVDSQFEGDDDGTVFKLEGIREYTSTQNGDPEGRKLSQPIGWVLPFDIGNFGDDPEQYRWGFMIQSDRGRDDYSSIIRMGKAFSLTGTALKQAASEAIDIESWARLFALQSLLGIGDVYGVDNPHNFAFYARPSDGRIVALQNDWEFAFNASTAAPINGNKNVYKLLRLPGIQRVYQGQLLDLIESVANSAYIGAWVRHFTAVMGENYNGFSSYAAARANSVRSQLIAKIPFEITSNSGQTWTVNTPSVTLQGRGWIDVHKVYLAGESRPLPVTWLDDRQWQVTVPLYSSSNHVSLQARNYRGAEVGRDSITVLTSGAEFPQREHLRISEVMYHPLPPNGPELSAGFSDADDFEFIELVNIGEASISLAGARFVTGISFDLSTSAVTELPPGSRIVLVSNRAAFAARYGTNVPVAGEYTGSLSNGGERLVLLDAAGGVIHDFEYGDDGDWPERADGDGQSLVVREYSGEYNAPENWKVSSRLNGSPSSGEAVSPELTAAVNNGQIRITFQAAAGATYEIHGSTSLTPAVWAALKTLPPGSASRVEEYLETPGSRTRFYRVLAK